MIDNVLVSVICICYNHENYIRDALEGFVMQKTNFRFEVIIHDDASTDRTPEIIAEYKKKYPNLFFPILQKENQYKKGVDKFKNFIAPLVRGKYSAYCEGDDYWTDPYKLQKQVDFLEKNEEYSICGHAYNRVNEEKVVLSSKYCGKKSSGDISIQDVIMNIFVPHTSTLMYRSRLRIEQPEFFTKCKVGDFPLRLYMISVGKMYYIHEIMSCYRVHEDNSWVTNMQNDIPKYKEHFDLLKLMLNNYDEYTNYCYSDLVKLRISNCDYKYFLVKKDWKNLLFNDYFRSLSLKEKMKSLLRCLFFNKRVF